MHSQVDALQLEYQRERNAKLAQIELDTQLNDIDNASQELTKEIKYLQQLQQQCEESLRNLITEREHQENKMRELKIEIENGERELEQLQKEIEELKRAQDILGDEIEEKQELLQRLRIEKEHLEQQQRSLQVRKEEVEEELQKLMETKEEIRQEIQRLEIEIEQIGNDTRALRTEMDSVIQEIQRLNEEHQALENEKNVIEEDIAYVEFKIEYIEAALQRLEQKLEKLMLQKSILEDSIVKVEKMIRMNTNEKEELKRKEQEMQNERNALDVEKMQEDVAIQATVQAIAEANKKMRELHNAKSGVLNNIAQLRIKFVMTNDKLAQQELEKSQQELAKQALSSNTDNIERDTTNFMNTKKSIEQAMNDTRNKLTQLTNTKKALVLERNTLQQALNSLKTSLQCQQDKVISLTMQGDVAQNLMMQYTQQLQVCQIRERDCGTTRQRAEEEANQANNELTQAKSKDSECTTKLNQLQKKFIMAQAIVTEANTRLNKAWAAGPPCSVAAVASAQAAVTSAMMELTAAQVNLREATTNSSRAKQHLASAKSELLSKQAQQTKASNALCQAQAVARQANSKLTEQENTVKALTGQLKQEQDKENRFQTSVNEHEALLQRNVESMTNVISNLSTENKNLEMAATDHENNETLLNTKHAEKKDVESRVQRCMNQSSIITQIIYWSKSALDGFNNEDTTNDEQVDTYIMQLYQDQQPQLYDLQEKKAQQDAKSIRINRELERVLFVSQNLNKSLSQLEDEKILLQKQKQSSETEVSELETNIKEGIITLNKTKNEKATTIRDLNKKEIDLWVKTEEMKGKDYEKTILIYNVITLNERLSCYLSEWASKKKQLPEKENNVDYQKTTISSIANCINEVEKKIQVFIRKIDEHSHAMKNKSREVKYLRENLAREQRIRNTLETKISTMRSNLADIKQDIVTKSNHIEELNSAKDNYKLHILILDSDLQANSCRRNLCKQNIVNGVNIMREQENVSYRVHTVPNRH
jgi:chromosome segregation ATPase